jgi:ABC-type dipeptide/oligopeptide/nickel transport system permease component
LLKSSWLGRLLRERADDVLTFIARRVLISIPLLIAVSFLAFLLMQLTPGDPARLMLGQDATPELIAQLTERLGLDRSLPEQYLRFLGNLFQGDLGRSFSTNLPVADELARTWPATLQLAVGAIILALVVGIPLGILSAVLEGSWFDYLTKVLVLASFSMPIYWLGLLFIYLFAVQLAWLPTSGSGTPLHLVLPTVSLAIWSMAAVVRMTRASMLEVLTEDYIRTARAKGLRESALLVRHALRPALNPVVTLAGLQFGQLMAGAVLTETVFSWPGVGRLMVVAVFARDYPMIRGIVLLVAATFILVNLIVDILYAVLDPRIRYS